MPLLSPSKISVSCHGFDGYRYQPTTIKQILQTKLCDHLRNIPTMLFEQRSQDLSSFPGGRKQKYHRLFLSRHFQILTPPCCVEVAGVMEISNVDGSWVPQELCSMWSDEEVNVGYHLKNYPWILLPLLLLHFYCSLIRNPLYLTHQPFSVATRCVHCPARSS